MTPAQEAIALLIDLAQQGEIDPWDVQVIEVIDRYLSELGLTENDTEYDHADLPQSGQAFLWASMLVLLKADTLQRLEEAEESDLEAAPEDELIPEERHRNLPLRLENHIRRRPTAPPPRKRRVTLQELITQIEELSTAWEDDTHISRSKRPRNQSRREATRIVSQLAHNENLTELAQQLEQFLMLQLPQLAPESDSVDLDELLDWWTQINPTGDNGHNQLEKSKQDRVGVFWALLLLSSQSKVDLSQDEFYQDLTIRAIN